MKTIHPEGEVDWPAAAEAAFDGQITRATSLGGNYVGSVRDGLYMNPRDKGCYRFKSADALRLDPGESPAFDPAEATVEEHHSGVKVDAPTGRVYIPIYRFEDSWFVRCSGETVTREPCSHLDLIASRLEDISTVQTLDGVYGEPKEPRIHYDDGDSLVAVSAFGGPGPFEGLGDPTPTMFTICEIVSKT